MCFSATQNSLGAFDEYDVPSDYNLYIYTIYNTEGTYGYNLLINNKAYWSLGGGDKINFDSPFVVPGGSTLKTDYCVQENEVFSITGVLVHKDGV